MSAEQAGAPFIESIDDFFDKTGPLPPTFDDARRFPRFYYRSCAEIAVHPFCGRQATAAVHCFVLTRDLSRSGLSLLHNEQLFPSQRIDLILNGAPPRTAEVVWCRRMGDQRYAVGCRFSKADAGEKT